jgi:hypothetical protein
VSVQRRRRVRKSGGRDKSRRLEHSGDDHDVVALARGHVVRRRLTNSIQPNFKIGDFIIYGFKIFEKIKIYKKLELISSRPVKIFLKNDIVYFIKL